MKQLNVWGNGGHLIAFSGVDGQTDYNGGLTIMASRRKHALEFKIPAGGEVEFGFALPKDFELAGDFGIFGKSRFVLTDAHHILFEGDFIPRLAGGVMECRAHGNRLLVAPAGKLDPAWLDCDFDAVLAERRAFIDRHSAPSGLSPQSARAYARAISQFKTQIYAPEGKFAGPWSTPDRFPHRMLWLWDSVFHAVGMRHLNIKLARRLISAVFDTQEESGFIPHMVSPFFASEITQPPILGWGIAMVNEVEYDEAWTKTLIPKLGRYLEWVFAHRDLDGGGLAEWFIEGEPSCRCGESGMDNSPRFDAATAIDAVDFNCYLANECRIMARLDGGRAGYWQAKFEQYRERLNRFCWDEATGFYYDYDPAAGSRTPVMASSGFLPLFAGVADARQAEKLRKHLLNPATFRTAYRIPSIAVCAEKYYSKDMWRGPVWVNLNYLVALGLAEYGFDADSAELIADTMSMEEFYHERYGSFFEFYDDRAEDDPPKLLRKPHINGHDEIFGQPLRDFGWSGTLYIDMVHRRSAAGEKNAAAVCACPRAVAESR